MRLRARQSTREEEKKENNNHDDEEKKKKKKKNLQREEKRRSRPGGEEDVDKRGRGGRRLKLKLAADADFLPSTWSPPVAQTQQLARSSLGREVSNSDAGQDVTGTRRVTESSWPDFFFFFYFSLLILLFVVFFFSTAYRPHCETRGGDSKLALDAARKTSQTPSQTSLLRLQATPDALLDIAHGTAIMGDDEDDKQ
ncbi:hypothetical protein A7C99_7024 [Trichophyton rubrum]|uniref:Transmembrane protein n=1 Tax=Trichophyton rubrum TaxID=5551 RepID=A0A178ER78_TRIRU|nr:hypothetical protein A7C99_7024 [Trichophyton rubrum]